jgi:hypothetical protein
MKDVKDATATKESSGWRKCYCYFVSTEKREKTTLLCNYRIGTTDI